MGARLCKTDSDVSVSSIETPHDPDDGLLAPVSRKRSLPGVSDTTANLYRTASSKAIYTNEHQRHHQIMQLLTEKGDLCRKQRVAAVSLSEAQYLLEEMQKLLISRDEIKSQAEATLKMRLASIPDAIGTPALSSFLVNYFSDDVLVRDVAKVSRPAAARASDSGPGQTGSSLSRTFSRSANVVDKIPSPVTRARRQSSISMFIDASHQSAATKAIAAITDWDFDIFEAQKVLGENTLSICAYAIFAEYSPSDVGASQLKLFLTELQQGYVASNAYHNALHAADVMQSMCHFYVKCGLNEITSATLRFASFLAAAAHDVGHPGVNNQYLVNTADSLAVTYNDISPLENFHSSFAFKLMHHEEANILSSFSPDQAVGIRRAVIEMILATDNALHTKFLSRLSDKVDSGTMFTGDNSGEDQLLLLRCALHAADVSNPAKPQVLYQKWTERIVTEFYLQGDKERALGLTVGPLNDRLNPIPEDKFQIGFISAIVLPLYKVIRRVPGMDIQLCVDTLEKNLQRWKGVAPVSLNSEVSGRPSVVAEGGEEDVDEKPPTNSSLVGSRPPEI